MIKQKSNFSQVLPRGHMVYLNSKSTCPLCQRTRRWSDLSPSPEERGKVSALLTDEGWTSARELSLTSVKLEMTEHIILLILSFTGARDLICSVLSQVATLIRRPAGATFPRSSGEGLPKVNARGKSLFIIYYLFFLLYSLKKVLEAGKRKMVLK